MRVSTLLLVVVVLLGLSSVLGAHRLKAKLAVKAKADGNSCTYLGETQQCSVWCTENCGGPCSSCESESGNVCACDDIPAINTKTLAKADGNSCTYLGATQQCSVWCTENCGGPCSSCESESGNECACDDVPAINTKTLAKADGNSCTYLGETQQCSVWCTENCGAPCSSCEAESGAICACDDIPAINTAAAVWIRDPVGNSCSYLGETQECSEWCTNTCGAPCSTCAEGSNDVVCACDEIPAISDKKAVWIKAETKQGYSCSYLGETQDCATWCTNTCGAPCSTCFGSEDNNNVCECDAIPAISDIKLTPNEEKSDNQVWIRDPVGNSCSYLGETQECSEWCTNTCGAPCSSCAEGSNDVVCACDEVPALNDKKLIADPVGNSCTYLGATQQCSVWCTENCGAPCSSCEAEDGAVCACDDLPAINTAAVWIRDPVGNSCSYLGETQECSEWCTNTCGAPCSTCAEGSNDVVCACDEVPALNDAKAAMWIKADGNSCSYLGVTQQCSEWCTNTCGAPCSACEIADGSVCACDDIPAINTAAAVWIRDPVGNSCSYLGETQECSEWCTNTCGAPCSTCAEGSNDVVCACDDIPAISDIAIKNGVKVHKK